MTAVIYARYSSDNQREESIEGQIRECTAYAEKNGITIVKHYIDRAISAKTDNRPEFQQMIFICTICGDGNRLAALDGQTHDGKDLLNIGSFAVFRHGGFAQDPGGGLPAN